MVTRLEYIRTEIVTVVEFTYSLEEPCVLLQVSDEISIISVSYLSCPNRGPKLPGGSTEDLILRNLRIRWLSTNWGTLWLSKLGSEIF